MFLRFTATILVRIQRQEIVNGLQIRWNNGLGNAPKVSWVGWSCTTDLWPEMEKAVTLVTL